MADGAPLGTCVERPAAGRVGGRVRRRAASERPGCCTRRSCNALATASRRWLHRRLLRGHPQRILLIPGTTKLHRLKENLGAANVALSDADVLDIEEASARISIHGARYPEAHERLTGR